MRLCGEARAAQESPDARAAEADFREAITNAEELGMRPLIAQCHLGLGQLHRRTGQRDQALEHATTAITMFREMDMRFLLAQAETGT